MFTPEILNLQKGQVAALKVFRLTLEIPKIFT